MKAIVEIKLNKRIKNVSISSPGNQIYEDVIDQILVDGGYELIEVSPFFGNPDNHRDFTESKLKNVTFVSLVIDLEENQIKDFEKHEHDIIGLALDNLGKKYMDIIDVSIDDDTTSLFFNDEDNE